jgi:hypothetical protein
MPKKGHKEYDTLLPVSAMVMTHEASNKSVTMTADQVRASLEASDGVEASLKECIDELRHLKGDKAVIRRAVAALKLRESVP